MATKKTKEERDINVKKEDLQKSIIHERPEPVDSSPIKQPVDQQVDTPVDCSFMPAKLKDGNLVVIITLGKKKISIPMEQFLVIATQVHRFYAIEKNKEKSSIITPLGTTRDKKIIIP